MVKQTNGSRNLIADVEGVLIFAVVFNDESTFNRLAIFNSRNYTVSVYVDKQQKGLSPFWGYQTDITAPGLRPKIRVEVRCASEGTCHEILIPLIAELDDSATVYRLDPAVQTFVESIA